MSLESVVPYFDSKMSILGYESWDDEFNIDNIPRTRIDKVYHLAIGTIIGNPPSHTCLEFEVPITVTFHSCMTKPLGSSQAANEMMTAARCIIAEICALEDRYNQEFLGVDVASIVFEPISTSNDNIVRVRIEFGVQLKEEFRKT